MKEEILQHKHMQNSLLLSKELLQKKDSGWSLFLTTIYYPIIY